MREWRPGLLQAFNRCYNDKQCLFNYITVPNLPIVPARPEAMPPFWRPTSKAIVRAEFLSNLNL